MALKESDTQITQFLDQGLVRAVAAAKDPAGNIQKSVSIAIQSETPNKPAFINTVAFTNAPPSNSRSVSGTTALTHERDGEGNTTNHRVDSTITYKGSGPESQEFQFSSSLAQPARLLITVTGKNGNNVTAEPVKAELDLSNGLPTSNGWNSVSATMAIARHYDNLGTLSRMIRENEGPMIQEIQTHVAYNPLINLPSGIDKLINPVQEQAKASRTLE